MNNNVIYKIFHKKTKIVYYIGQTKQDLLIRYIKHCKSLTNFGIFLTNEGIDNFCIEAIESNIPDDLINDLEKKYIRQYSRQYPLLNIQYNQNIKTFQANTQKGTQTKRVKCITTGEIFNNVYEACKKYNINITNLMKYINKSNYSIGYDDNDNPLHWQYLDENDSNEIDLADISKTNISDTMMKKKYYTIYAIIQLIDNTWTPIYIGITKNSLEHRFNEHKRTLREILYSKLLQYPLNTFNIIKLFDNICVQDAWKLEQKCILHFSEKYQLYNITDNFLKKDTHLIINNLKNTACICFESKLYFNNIYDASKYYNISATNIIRSCLHFNFNINNLHFQFYNKLIKNIWSIYMLQYKNNKIIFISRYLIIDSLNKMISEDPNSNKILSIINNWEEKDILITIIHNNIDNKNEALQLKNIYIGILADYGKIDTFHINRYIRRMTPINVINQYKIYCITTKQIFNSIKHVCLEYDLISDELKKHLNKLIPYIYSSKLKSNLQFQLIDNSIINCQHNNNLYKLYYIYYNTDIKMVIYSKDSENKILSHFFTVKRQKIISQQLDCNKFSIKCIHQNIPDKEQAKKIKIQHIQLLKKQNYRFL